MFCVAEMQNWLTRTNEEVTLEVPALVAVVHRQLLQHRQLSRRIWDFNHDLSQAVQHMCNFECTVHHFAKMCVKNLRVYGVFTFMLTN